MSNIAIVDRELVFDLYPKREGSIVGPVTRRDIHKIVVPSLERLKAFARDLRRELDRLFDLQMSNSAESDLMSLVVQNTAWANLGNTAGVQPSSAAGSLFVSLHTATLTASSTQSTSEAAYTGYARVGVARSSGGWTKTGSSPTVMENAAAVTFGACTAGSETETNFATGVASSGATEILWYGALTASLAVSAGITPSFAINALTVSML